MALLNTFTDSRTLAALASGANVTYAHGLGAAPDNVNVFANASTTATATPASLSWNSDATNVTIWNNGGAGVASLKAVAQIIHSVNR